MSKARHARARRSTRRVARTLSIAGLGAGITAAGAGAAFATDYQVKAGDTLSEIAQANGADWHELARINNLKDPNLILIGQTLSLDGVKKAATPAPKKVTKKSEAKKSEKTERKARTSRSEDRPSTKSGKANLSGAWAKVANCESSGNPRAVNPAGYYGLFQFDLQTWRSVGGSGNPAKASAAEQLMRAKKLYAQRGASPWPVCGKYLR
ncbi:transglycosylase family protein [Kribbella speibonae]|uniref:LysM peptidoglycan-binding domain-containing protein n=1 Tax=Kribbella speibonae TaxID=1572660 RepID=A0A4V6N4B3_9ACTN|nr:transglycosylase family protein [Kribbella speibonae]TCC21064.1 LysM peptidoglycan-binding domain-containing protein [Kribbella speibonae]TCC41072.1 LysM peptidoglycan-binding domain-containing protein [Kribbella speibonae]